MDVLIMLATTIAYVYSVCSHFTLVLFLQLLKLIFMMSYTGQKF